VQLVIRQNFCIPHLPLLKCYNSTALHWYQTVSEWHYHISARKPRQLWLWWYAVHRDPSSDGSPTWIQATLRFGLHLELARCIRKNKIQQYYDIESVTEQILAKVFKSLPHGSAVGPRGWAYEHIKAASSTSEDAWAAVLRLMQAAVCCDLSHLPGLLDARVIPLEKKSGGVRPIAVCEVC
jgi:hypothetical protein